MKRVFGEQPAKRPEFSRQIVFPQLAKVDEWTGDDRLLESAGGGVRSLPRTIYAQYRQGVGHEGAEVVGALHEVTIDPDTKLVSGRGWLMAGPEGDKVTRHIAAQALRHNSVDLAEVSVELEYDDDADWWDYKARFTKWNIGATTLVGMPAFADAAAELDNADLAAALTSDEPLVVTCRSSVLFATPASDLTARADAAMTVPWEDFHIPEPDVPHKVTLDPEGRLLGSLAKWDSCWGDEDRVAACIRPPRPADNYASYLQPGVLTDRGMVDTAPVFLVNGHPEIGPTDEDFNKAYGGTENAFADIRIIPGVHGPWISGRVRPGATEEQIYAARASRYSGHWRRGQLRAIVAVNVAGFDVGGSGRDVKASFTLDEDGEVIDLIASMPCDDEALFEWAADQTDELILESELNRKRLELALALGD